jgi:hypothetical protein
MLRCINARCDGRLDKVIDSRPGSDDGSSSRRSFQVAKNLLTGDGFRWRVRRCRKCGEDAVTIEMVAGPKFQGQDKKVSGELCLDCGGARMMRSGTCLTCLDCGRSQGCG